MSNSDFSARNDIQPIDLSISIFSITLTSLVISCRLLIDLGSTTFYKTSRNAQPSTIPPLLHPALASTKCMHFLSRKRMRSGGGGDWVGRAPVAWQLHFWKYDFEHSCPEPFTLVHADDAINFELQKPQCDFVCKGACVSLLAGHRPFSLPPAQTSVVDGFVTCQSPWESL